MIKLSSVLKNHCFRRLLLQRIQSCFLRIRQLHLAAHNRLLPLPLQREILPLYLHKIEVLRRKRVLKLDFLLLRQPLHGIIL